MSAVVCPVCNKPLNQNKTTYFCENLHSFDISKYGYVNLLLSQKSSKKRHGDDKQMILARKDFLEKGYYQPLKDEVCDLAKKLFKGKTFVDTGCGECYYTQGVVESLPKETQAIGIDISKDALRFGAKRVNNISLIAASIFNMPIKDNSVDMLLNMFAPLCENEFCRIVKKDGILFRVFPLEKHLLSLKQSIYENVYLNKIDTLEINGFKMLLKKELKYNISVENSVDIENLFKMTPYYYKTGKNDQQKILSLSRLETQVEFLIAVYKKD